MIRAGIEWRHAVLLGGRVGATNLLDSLRHRLLGRTLVAGRQCRLSRTEISDDGVELSHHGLELLVIDVRRRLAARLAHKSRELISDDAGLHLLVDFLQLPVHFGTVFNELPDKRLFDLGLVRCGPTAAPCADAGKKDERRTHDPNPTHGPSFRSAALHTPIAVRIRSITHDKKGSRGGSRNGKT